MSSEEPDGPRTSTFLIAAPGERRRTGAHTPNGGETACWSMIVLLLASRAIRVNPDCCAADALLRPIGSVTRTNRLTTACPSAKPIAIEVPPHVERYCPPSLPPDGPGLPGHSW